MSSHHIVREKQEPALYIHDLEGFDEEMLGQLLEWSPTVIVSAASFEKANSMGLKVDMVGGSLEGDQAQENLIHLPSPGDPSDAVFQELINSGYPAVTVISNTVRYDLLDTYGDKLTIVWLTPETKTFRIRDGFSVWKPAGTMFKFANPTTGMATGTVVVDGAKVTVKQDGFVNFSVTNAPAYLTEFL